MPSTSCTSVHALSFPSFRRADAPAASGGSPQLLQWSHTDSARLIAALLSADSQQEQPQRLVIFNMFALEAWHCSLACGVPAVLASAYPPWTSPGPGALRQLEVELPILHAHMQHKHSLGMQLSTWRRWAWPLLSPGRWEELWRGIQTSLAGRGGGMHCARPGWCRAPLPPLQALLLCDQHLHSHPELQADCCGMPPPLAPSKEGGLHEAAMVLHTVHTTFGTQHGAAAAHETPCVGFLLASLATPERMGVLADAGTVLATLSSLSDLLHAPVLLQCCDSVPGGLWDSVRSSCETLTAGSRDATVSVPAWCSWVQQEAKESIKHSGVFCLPITIEHSDLAAAAKAVSSEGTPPPHPFALLHHGGVGTARTALQLGIPQVMVPFAFDQPARASHWESAGLAGAVLRCCLQADSSLLGAYGADSDDGNDSDSSLECLLDTAAMLRLRIGSSASALAVAVQRACQLPAPAWVGSSTAESKSSALVAGKFHAQVQRRLRIAVTSFRSWQKRRQHQVHSSLLYPSLQSHCELYSAQVELVGAGKLLQVRSVVCPALEISVGGQEEAPQPPPNSAERRLVKMQLCGSSASEMQFLFSELWAGGVYMDLLRAALQEHGSTAVPEAGAPHCILVLDVGAHVGLFTMQALKLLSSTSHPVCIVAVEPVSSSVTLLLDNLALMGADFSLVSEPAHLEKCIEKACTALQQPCHHSRAHVLVCPWALAPRPPTGQDEAGVTRTPCAPLHHVRMHVPSGRACQARLQRTSQSSQYKPGSAALSFVRVPCLPPTDYFGAIAAAATAVAAHSVLVKVDVEGSEVHVVRGLLQQPPFGVAVSRGGQPPDLHVAVEVSTHTAEHILEDLKQHGAIVFPLDPPPVDSEHGWVLHASLPSRDLRDRAAAAVHG